MKKPKPKPKATDRMNISYMPKELHKKIKIYCVNKGITLAKWSELAHEALSTGKK